MYKIRFLNNFNGSFGGEQSVDATYTLNTTLLDFDFDGERYIEEDYFVREPRQATFKLVADDYLKDNFLAYDRDNEISYVIESNLEDVEDVTIYTRMSKKIVQLLKDDEVVYHRSFQLSVFSSVRFLQ